MVTSRVLPWFGTLLTLGGCGGVADLRVPADDSPIGGHASGPSEPASGSKGVVEDEPGGMSSAIGPVFMMNVGKDAAIYSQFSQGIAPGGELSDKLPLLYGTSPLDTYVDQLSRAVTGALDDTSRGGSMPHVAHAAQVGHPPIDIAAARAEAAGSPYSDVAAGVMDFALVPGQSEQGAT